MHINAVWVPCFLWCTEMTSLFGSNLCSLTLLKSSDPAQMLGVGQEVGSQRVD